jgi:hypothetical protein
LVGQTDSVRSYSRSLAAQLLLSEMPDPQGAGLTPDEAWGLVRLRAFKLSATCTDAAIAQWAGTFADEFAVQAECAAAAVGGSGRGVVAVSQLPDFLKPGESGTTVLFGERWGVNDHDELLTVGRDEPERAKCLYLSIAVALKIIPADLLSALRVRSHRPAPKAGELVPEATLYVFELAHDLLERDHPQIWASLLWFGDIVLEAVQHNFVCVMPDGDVRVGLLGSLWGARQRRVAGLQARLGHLRRVSRARARLAGSAREAQAVGVDRDGVDGRRAGYVIHVGLCSPHSGSA